MSKIGDITLQLDNASKTLMLIGEAAHERGETLVHCALYLVSGALERVIEDLQSPAAPESHSALNSDQASGGDHD